MLRECLMTNDEKRPRAIKPRRNNGWVRILFRGFPWVLTAGGSGSTMLRPLGVCPSGQRDQTVNLTAYAFGGSNPPAPITAIAGFRSGFAKATPDKLPICD